ncbi:MAG: hypothetical protein ACMXYE_04605 [Candidatus Woesearchaeota archaeon]
MQPKKFTILGLILSLGGIFILTSFFLIGILNELANIQNMSDFFLTWSFILIPPLLIVLGAYYVWIGIKEKQTNKFISGSVIINLSSLAVLIVGLLMAIIPPYLGVMTWGFPLLILGIPASILLVIGISTLVVGLLVKN